MKLSSKQIEKIQNYFKGQKDVIAVYLYGSFATGNTHKRSDIDLGVLFDPPIKSYSRLGEIINALTNLKLPAEPDVREISLENSPVYLRNVISGELIYSSNEGRRIQFEVEAFNLFRDTEYLRQLKYFYMDQSLKEGTYGYRLLNS